MCWYQCTLCRKRSLYHKGLFYVPSLLYIYGSILCIAPSILHKMVPIYYSAIHTTYGYTDYCGALLLYIRWSLYIYSMSYVLLWVHLMYVNYCEVLLLYINTSYIGRNVGNQITWGLTFLSLQCITKILQNPVSLYELCKN